MAFVGSDRADTSHAICLQVAGSETREFSVLAHTPEASGAWACLLRQRLGGRPIAVCLELAKRPLVSALSAHDFLVLFPVNAHTVATYPQAFTHSRDPAGIVPASVLLEGMLPIVTPPRPKLGDGDADGTPDLMAKFGRTDLIQVLCDTGRTQGRVLLRVSGMVGDHPFEV